jgi:hypothetical protein
MSIEDVKDERWSSDRVQARAFPKGDPLVDGLDAYMAQRERESADPEWRAALERRGRELKAERLARRRRGQW